MSEAWKVCGALSAAVPGAAPVPASVPASVRGGFLVRYCDFPEELDLVQNLAGALDYAVQGLFRYGDGQLGLFPQDDIEVLKEGAASGKYDALVHEVSRQLGRCQLKYLLDGLYNGVNRLVQGLPYLPALYLKRGGYAGYEVGALYLELMRLFVGHGEAHRHLYHLRHAGAYGEVGLSLYVLNYQFVEFVSADVDTLCLHYARRGYQDCTQ